MWRNESDKKMKYDHAQLETEILLNRKRVFFIDGPSRCGKTHFIKNLQETDKIIYPTHLLIEELVSMFKEKIPMRMIYRRIESMFPCRILCLDDADIPLAGQDTMQQEMGRLVKRLSRKRKVLLLGIDLKKRCGALFGAMGEDAYEYYLFAAEA